MPFTGSQTCKTQCLQLMSGCPRRVSLITKGGTPSVLKTLQLIKNLGFEFSFEVKESETESIIVIIINKDKNGQTEIN